MSNNLLDCFSLQWLDGFPELNLFIWWHLPASISRPRIVCFSLPSSRPVLLSPPSFSLLSYFPSSPETQAFGIPKEPFLHPVSSSSQPSIWESPVCSCCLHVNSGVGLLPPDVTALPRSPVSTWGLVQWLFCPALLLWALLTMPPSPGPSVASLSSFEIVAHSGLPRGPPSSSCGTIGWHWLGPSSCLVPFFYGWTRSSPWVSSPRHCSFLASVLREPDAEDQPRVTAWSLLRVLLPLPLLSSWPVPGLQQQWVGVLTGTDLHLSSSPPFVPILAYLAWPHFYSVTPPSLLFDIRSWTKCSQIRQTPCLVGKQLQMEKYRDLKPDVK